MKVGVFLAAAAALLFGAAAVLAGKARPEAEGPFVIRFALGDPEDLETVLPQVKGRGVVFTGPAMTPWGRVQAVQRSCAKAGIPQVEWALGNQLLKISTMPSPKQDIIIVISRDRGATVRRVGTRKPVESDDDLASLILSMRIDYQKAGRTTVPVFIDADRDVPWGDIVQAVTLCRLTGFDEIDLDSPDRS